MSTFASSTSSVFANLFPQAVSQADALVRPFGERREGQIPRSFAALTIAMPHQLAAGYLTSANAIRHNSLPNAPQCSFSIPLSVLFFFDTNPPFG